mgnify:CR=1 FL=1|jgi:hypothetical protein
MNTFPSALARALAALLALGVAQSALATPTHALRQLPEALQGVWASTKPEMNANSRCAAAFDSQTDTARMVMRCSVHMRLGAEAERRALAYCQEERERKGVRSPCRIVQE